MAKVGHKTPNGTAYSLCWDCAKATGGCPWADEGNPVEGWTAAVRRVGRGWKPFDSHLVLDCPMFVRDSVGGGIEKCLSEREELKNGGGNSAHPACVLPKGGMAQSDGSGRVDIHRDRMAVRRNVAPRNVTPERDVLDLAYGILERAVEDWKALQYGGKAEALVDGILISRREVARFFFSEWFKHLVEVTPYTAEQFRRYIRVPEDALSIIEFADAGRRLRHYDG